MTERTEWVRYDIPGSERPWFHHPSPCPLDHVDAPHLHSKNEDGTLGISVLTLAQLGIDPEPTRSETAATLALYEFLGLDDDTPPTSASDEHHP